MTAAEQTIGSLKGVGEARAKALNKLGIFTLGDLVNYFPRSYEDRTHFQPIMAAPLDEPVCIRAMVANAPTLARVRRGMELVKLRAVDESGSMDITFFNQTWVRNQLHQGETYVFYGRLSGNLTHRAMTNPDWEPEQRQGEKTGRILPKYPLCQGVSNKLLIGYVRSALDAIGPDVPDALPQRIQSDYGLAQARYAYETIHFPADFGALELARRRFIFEELFVLACAMDRLRAKRQALRGIPVPKADPAEFYAALPFQPTGAQRRAVAQALSDMASGMAMNRLVQGDVGSGKTLVAAACIWAVCRSGRQCAFMAPTEILAEQHLATLRGFLAPFHLRVEKLTGSMTAKEKRETKAALSAGEIDLIVGTHALLTEDVAFSDLALVVTDEQHRFGVNQRSALSGKGETPHVLVMSATPIPRTLALIIYGDLDVSIIDELPPGRQKVDTFTVDESYRQRLYGFIRKLVGEGRQVFVVCPMVEENEESDLPLKSAVEHAQALQSAFPDLRVGCIHGKMKPKDKDAVMAAVVAGELDILVSTTVIEVGVDVPNAALMIVENAERFGLSQLHQLRGRVGRGQHKSWCILISDAKNDEAKARLKAMCETNDGFKISEEDLRLRGPGDFFGSRQHGLPEMHIADLGADVRTLQTAQDAAKALLASDPELAAPENAALCARVQHLFAASERTMN
ncbi:MAG: ATP-dependent DNA helicase RecG [Ruminococcaceae bacterium]|nr:ATP-dependent DNA helicase RecG [Oscillospiraceae bacterium]